MTQAELGARLGADQTYVSKYESNRQRLDVIEFLRIATILKADIGALLKSTSDELSAPAVKAAKK